MKCIFLSLALLFAVVLHAQVPKVENNQLVLDGAVAFKTGTAELLPQSEAALKQVLAFLADKPFVTTLRVEGHAVTETVDGSQRLSAERAVAVVRWLQAAGADCKRLLPVGFGETKPVVAPDAVEKARNTRVVFAVAALRNRPIGGLPVDGGGRVAAEPCQW